MYHSGKNQFICIIVLACFFMLPELCKAQSGKLNELFSIRAENEPLGAVLDRLSRNTGLTFSYNPDQIKADRIISINEDKQPLNEILKKLLDPKDFGFRISGNQVVLFRHSPELTPKPETVQPPQLSIQTPVIEVQRDTIYIQQLKTISDTIIVKDTLTRFDTVFILRKSPDDRVGKDDIFKDRISLEKEMTKEWQFSLGPVVGFTQSNTLFSGNKKHAGKISKYDEVTTSDQLSYSLGLDFEASFNQISVTTGVHFTSLIENFEYNYNILTGGYYRKDTIEFYYTDDPPATIYIIDSTYIPVDQEQYGYDSKIKHNYIDIPLMFKYNFPVERFFIYARAGVIAGIHAGSSGYYIEPDDMKVGLISDLNAKPLVLSYALGAGVVVPIKRKLVINTGFTYRKGIHDIYIDFPITHKQMAYSVHAGLIFRIK
jgi:hypothetical protein